MPAMSASGNHHGDHDHDHGHLHAAGERRERVLRSAFALIATFMVVEAVVGWLTNALTLLADAGHMFLDASALGFSWYAVHLSARASDEKLTYGYHRWQVLAAFVNGLLLIVLSVAIVLEAVERLGTPAPMIAGPALAVACVGLVVNLLAYRMLHADGGHDINVRSAALHVLGDILGSVAAIAAAATALLTGWPYADPILACVVVAILLRGALRVLRESSHILLEGVPKHLDLEQIRDRLNERVGAAAEVHHLHAWALTSDRPLITLHARVLDGSDGHDIVGRIKAVLAAEFGLDHSTVQVERGPCPDEH
jgi:cobalt-zinc-cadmium efflux system protein